MKHFLKSAAGLCLAAALFCSSIMAQLPANLANPVLPRVADAGVIRYNGEYYIGGVFTNGGFYRSSDLVNWTGPFHVFSMNNRWTRGSSAGDDQIHASDIVYLNGTFHHYWSVNYWGQEHRAIHIGHATSKKILGPYREPVTDQWFENRIDPQLFVDDDGKLYFYMVKFTDGNTIWGRPMKDPWTFSGDPVYQFASLRGTWETLDNRVAEGPWVMKYRTRYYMMYNANHTGPEWGNYALGIAEASSPLGFGHGNKYTHPVVQSNQIGLEDRYEDLLRSETDVFRFSNLETAGWQQPGFDDSSWKAGQAGFGSRVLEGSTTRRVRSSWTSGPLFLRKTFSAPAKKGNLSLRIYHDGPAKAWLNGRLVYQHEGRNYTQHLLKLSDSAALLEEENVLAVAVQPGPRSAFADVALFNMENDTPDDILFSPGQPNIVRGPNGFEWWLVYMANKNLEPRGQYINRVHFFGNKLVVDGPTAAKTPGFHPAPAAPAFGELFEGETEGKWRFTSGRLVAEAGAGLHTGKGALRAFPVCKPASHYLFEANIKPAGSQAAGIYAWYADENNYLQVGLDPVKKAWTWLRKMAGTVTSGQQALDPAFDYTVFHKLGVVKNFNSIRVEIDGRPAPGGELSVKAQAGLPGIYSLAPGTAFDGILYTIGWDEFGKGITGWQPASRRAVFETTAAGLITGRQTEPAAVLKGDPAAGYEFSAQISRPDLQGRAGLYAAYAGKDNWLRTDIDFRTGTLHITQVVDGKQGRPVSLSQQRDVPLHIDMKNTDMMEKHFTPDHRTLTDCISFRQEGSLKPGPVALWYRQGEKWTEIQTVPEPDTDRPGMWRLPLKPVAADGFRLINLDQPDRPFGATKIYMRQLSKASFNLRTVRAGAEMLVFVDNELAYRSNAAMGPSRVGLYSGNEGSHFDGLTFFER